MRHKVYIFDFDGTLVHSNLIKRQAFYHLTPEISSNKSVVDSVLAVIPERSRFEIIRTIYDGIARATGTTYQEEQITAAIENYSTAVREGVLACPELDGAGPLLKFLKESGRSVYISSNTPESSLGELIDGRKWLGFIKAYFGFPRAKAETVRHILNVEKVGPGDVIVIGDGTSDELSATENGCSFFKISGPEGLLEFTRTIKKKDLHV